MQSAVPKEKLNGNNRGKFIEDARQCFGKNKEAEVIFYHKSTSVVPQNFVFRLLQENMQNNVVS